MVVWGFEIGELLAAALRYRHLRFQQFCIKIIIKGIQKSEITDCDTRGCGMSVTDNGGVYFVPAFSGLFAPYWRNDARGVIVGMTRYTNKGHIARAVLEATAWQTREVLDAMREDAQVNLTALKVDGGMVYNNLLMQFQSDVLGVPVIRPQVAETTALGAAYAAGLATGFWSSLEELSENWLLDQTWEAKMDAVEREGYYRLWKKAVSRTFDWV
jgi:glycerol kinase